MPTAHSVGERRGREESRAVRRADRAPDQRLGRERDAVE